MTNSEQKKHGCTMETLGSSEPQRKEKARREKRLGGFWRQQNVKKNKGKRSETVYGV